MSQPNQQQDPFAEFGGNASEAQAPTVPAGTSQTPSSPATSQATPASSDPFAEFGGHEAGSSDQTSNDPRQTGEITNDVGQKVIVPKDGESFSDTLKRAVAYHKSLTPEQQQAALDAETKTIPTKTAQTLGAAATIGAVGPAVLAAPGELIQGVRAIPGISDALLRHAEAKAGEWAAQYPNLIGVAKALGVPTSTAAVLGWLYHNSKGKN